MKAIWQRAKPPSALPGEKPRKSLPIGLPAGNNSLLDAKKEPADILLRSQPILLQLDRILLGHHDGLDTALAGKGSNPGQGSLVIGLVIFEGLKAGDDIRVEGVQYGKVSKIALDPRGGVMVTIDLVGPLEIYEGYEIYVEAFTVLGGNYISVTRGNLLGRKLDTASVLKGKARPSALSEVGQLAQDNRKTIHELLTNLKDVTAAIKEGKGTIGKFINEDGLHTDLRNFVKEGKKSLSEVTVSVNKLLEGSGEGPVKELLHNKSMANDLKESVNSMKEVAATMKRISKSVEKGEGLAGAVMKDKEMENRFKRTMENIEAVTEKMKRETGTDEDRGRGKDREKDKDRKK